MFLKLGTWPASQKLFLADSIKNKETGCGRKLTLQWEGGGGGREGEGGEGGTDSSLQLL